MADKAGREEKWEFGSLEWCRFAAETGTRLLREAGLDLSRYRWGFSEEYTHLPERLLAGRDRAGFYLMIKDGEISGGAGVPEECLALPGFHASVPWALIARASAVEYDLSGQMKRFAQEAKLRVELEAAGVLLGKTPSSPAPQGKPRCPVCGSSDHDREHCPVWPPGIGEALAAGAERGGGLHNLTARRIRPSPELEDLPVTELGVPIFSQMTEEQKARFIRLLGG